MNIELIGRIRPTLGNQKNTLIIDGSKVSATAEGPFLNLSALHLSDVTNDVLFRRSLEDLFGLFMMGYNVSVLVLGETESGRSYTMSGEGVPSLGIVPMIFERIFLSLTKAKYEDPGPSRRHNDFHVTLQMMEIYNELIKDLLAPPSDGGPYKEIAQNAEHGAYVKGANKVTIKDSTDGSVHFRQGMARRTGVGTDYGLASQHSAIVVFIDLEKHVNNSPGPHRSRFSIVKVPGLDRLPDSYNDLLQREEPILNKALTDLNAVVKAMSGMHFPGKFIPYDRSKLIQLLEDEIGGNCMTKAVLCLKPDTHPDTLRAILRFCNRLTNVMNYPIINDWGAQGLIKQYRARIIDLLPDGDTGKMSNQGNVQKSINELETQNLFYKDENERLKRSVDDLKSKMENMAFSKTDLSKQFLSTEEDKLRISQSLVELQLENIRIKQEAEEKQFKLSQRLEELQAEEMKWQDGITRSKKASRHAEELRMESDRNRKDLADEYTNLMANRMTLVKELEKERKRNEELSIALLNMAAKHNNRGGTVSPGHDIEVSKAKEILRQNEAQKQKDTDASEIDRIQVENLLSYERKKYEKEISKLEMDHRDSESKLQQNIAALQREIEESRLLGRDRQRRLAELNSSLIMTRAEKEQLEVQTNRLQHKVKVLGEDYRYKLLKYVEDVSAYIDKTGSDKTVKMKDYMQSMIKDLTKSHKDREEQLAEAAQQHKGRQRTLQQQYEQLLVQYRSLRIQCEERGIKGIDLGPDESELNLPESIINSANMKEIIRLKSEVNKLRKLELDGKLKTSKADTGYGKMSTDGIGSVGDFRKQLREFTSNTVKELEIERAKLLSDNSSLREQLKAEQDYIKDHLKRYKEEIIKLRKQLGYDVSGPLVGVDVSYRKNRRK